MYDVDTGLNMCILNKFTVFEPPLVEDALTVTVDDPLCAAVKNICPDSFELTSGPCATLASIPSVITVNSEILAAPSVELFATNT